MAIGMGVALLGGPPPDRRPRPDYRKGSRIMLIPAPKVVHENGQFLQLKRGEVLRLSVSAGTPAEQPTVKVIRSELKRLFGQFGGIALSVKWKNGLVAAPHIPEQAYELEVSGGKIVIRANTAVGALYGVSTLRQLKTAPDAFLQAEIRDWPDIEIRIAGRPLLCAETRGSALDWGDGQQGFIRRWKEEIDFALRFRFNAFFAWGFSWDTEPFPGFKRCFKILNAYARARGVRLTFGGYGIAKNDTGRVRILTDTDRRSSGLGAAVAQTYPCSRVDPRQKPDVFCGTCRSNPEIRAQKIKDLAAFVKAVEPSLLYIHHEDLNTIDATQKQFWDSRCPACRKKWPDDRIEALHGGAGAIADTMNAYSEALASVPVSKTGYNAMRDCVILYTSPGYGDWLENTEQWNRVKALWCNVIRQLNHPEHFSVTVREQFRDETSSRLRIGELSRQIRRISPRCGLHVFSAGGADLWYNNAPFSPSSELFSAFEGARAVFAFNGILFQRPQLMFNAECLWNISAESGSLVKKLPPTREECHRELQSIIDGKPLPEFCRDPEGWLARACCILYGKQAGEKMFRYQQLRSPSGCYPLSILYYEMRMRRKLFRIMDDPGTDRKAEVIHWTETIEISRQGLKLVQEALKAPVMDMTAPLRRELEQQEKCLEAGIALAQAALAFFSGDAAGYAARVEKFIARVKPFPHNFIAPEEGDASLYDDYIIGLKNRIRNQHFSNNP